MSKKLLIASAFSLTASSATAATVTYSFEATVSSDSVTGVTTNVTSAFTDIGTTITGTLSYDPAEVGTPGFFFGTEFDDVAISLDVDSFNNFVGAPNVAESGLITDEDFFGNYLASFSQSVLPSVLPNPGNFLRTDAVVFYEAPGGSIAFDTPPPALTLSAANFGFLQLTASEISRSGVGFGSETQVGSISYSANITSFTLISAVPLPASLPLMIAGFAGMGLLARRRRAT